MAESISALDLKEALHDGTEVALLDVREYGQYGAGHPFYAVSAPYSEVELRVVDLVPRRSARCIVFDNGDGVAERAAQRLEAIGYSNVHTLSGGIAAWVDAGLEVFEGVNVPSKAFGELVEHGLDTPALDAPELQAKIDAGENMVILDGRTPQEYQRMNIPGGRSCPNAELTYRIEALAPDPQTTIVINCAGRTRSIIGAQTLINAGIDNPVYALRNGTMGWTIAGLELQRGTAPQPQPDVASDTNARQRAERLTQLAAVRGIDAAQLERWRQDPARSLFVLDVRTAEEFAAGHLPGSRHAPGGQLVQATDEWVGVRGARIVLVDDNGVRAGATAHWLRQLGHDAVVLENGLKDAELTMGEPVAALPPPMRPGLQAVSAETAATQIEAGGTQVLDVGKSGDFCEAHVAGAIWGVRPRLAEVVSREAARIILVADDPRRAELAALDLREMTEAELSYLDGGTAAWQAAGLPVETSSMAADDPARIDFIDFTFDRHHGNLAAMHRYLDWETDLLNHLDEREMAAFQLAGTAS